MSPAALDAAVLAHAPDGVALRHALHRQPELSRALVNAP